MLSPDQKSPTDFFEQLQLLEYAVRRSMIVREDIEEPAELQHIQSAEQLGIPVPHAPTKGELLSVVQTAVRATKSGSDR